MSRRGANPSASGAAILILLIATILVLYILFLPPDERAELLGEENGTYSGDNSKTTKSGYNKTLLIEKIGHLDHLKFNFREYDLPSFRVFSESEASIIKNINSIYVAHSLGEKKDYNLSFNLDKKMTSNIKLGFTVTEASGRLEVYLNGDELINSELRKGSIDPVVLSDDSLMDENKLTFRVSKSGIAFWRNNRYTLEKVIITGDILDNSHSSSRQYFYISEEEKSNLETVKLKFYPDCKIDMVGPLLIYLNGDEVFSGLADCGIYNSMFLDKNTVLEGKNELEFIATDGAYLIDRVSVRTELEELLQPVYYFDLEEELFEKDDDLKDEFNVTMTVKFVNDDEKRVEYLINGRRRHISTNEITFITKLDDYVVSETNSLEIVPQSDIDIASLKIILSEE